MSLQWSETIEAWVEETVPPTLEQRVATLETQLADALEWIAELGDDVISRTARKEGQIDG